MHPLKIRLLSIFSALVLFLLPGMTGAVQKAPEEETQSFWMGVYMNGVKVGHQHFRTSSVMEDGRHRILTRNESRILVSLLLRKCCVTGKGIAPSIPFCSWRFAVQWDCRRAR
jgi:hypothetical protein